MVLQTIFKTVIFAIMVSLPQLALANSESTKIGIKVEIKAKQDCDYSYSLENASISKYSKLSHVSSCDRSAANLQLQAEQMVNSEFRTSQLFIGEKRLRVFIIVQ